MLDVFVGKVMSLLFNMLSRLVIAFLPRSISPTKVHIVKTLVFPVVMYGSESWTIRLSAEESMLLNCGVGEDSQESLGLQDQTRQS